MNALVLPHPGGAVWWSSLMFLPSLGSAVAATRYQLYLVQMHQVYFQHTRNCNLALFCIKLCILQHTSTSVNT